MTVNVGTASTTGRNTKQFDVAVDVAKQLLTLATGVITITITFSKDILGGSTAHRGWLELAWVFYFVSIFGGVWLLYAVSGSLASNDATKSPSIYDLNTAIPMGLQQVSFLVALGLTAYFGSQTL